MDVSLVAIVTWQAFHLCTYLHIHIALSTELFSARALMYSVYVLIALPTIRVKIFKRV